MSVDLNTLKRGDRVNFGGKIVKEVHGVYKYPDRGWKYISFEDGSGLRSIDELWELAELVKPEPPNGLRLAVLNHENCYVLKSPCCTYRPYQFLGLLKHDVTALESAGITENSK